MANASAFSQGYATGQGIAEQQRALKEARKQTEWEDKHNDLREAVKNTQQKLWTLDKNSPTYAQDHAQGLQDLTSSIQAYQDFFHPQKNPGMWEKARHLVGMEGKPHPLQAPQRIGDTQTTVNPGIGASSVDLGSGGASFPASNPTNVVGPKGQSQPTNPQGVDIPSSPAPVTLAATPAYDTKTASVGPTPTPDEYSAKPLYPSQVKDRAERLKKSQQQAGLMEAGAPQTPEEEAARQSRIAVTGEMTRRNAALKWAKENGITGPELDEVIQHLAGVPTVKVPKVIGQPYKDANTGRWMQRVQNPLDGTFSEVEVLGYSQTARPSSGAFNQYVDAYARDHGMTADQLPQSARDYLRQKWALDAAVATSTETNTLKEDFKGDWRPITEVNTRTPSAARQLVDPLGPNAGAAPQAGRGGQTPQQVREQSASRLGGGGASPNSRVRIGNPVFAGKNKEYDDQQTQVDNAVKRAKKMDDSYQVAVSTGSQQDMLNLLFNHIGMTQGAQKGARINQKSVDEAKASAPFIDSQIAKMFHQDETGDYIYDGPKGGVTLTKTQMKQMVDLAHETVKAEQESLNTITNRLENPNTSGGSGAKPKHSLKKAMGLDFNKGKSEADVRKDLESHGYEVTP